MLQTLLLGACFHCSTAHTSPWCNSSDLGIFTKKGTAILTSAPLNPRTLQQLRMFCFHFSLSGILSHPGKCHLFPHSTIFCWRATHILQSQFLLFFFWGKTLTQTSPAALTFQCCTFAGEKNCSVSYFQWAKLNNFIEKDKRAEDYGDFKVRSKHFFLYIRCGQRPASHWKQLQLTYVSDSSKAGAVSAAQVAGLCFCFPNIAERREREIRWICWSFREHFNQNCSCLQGLEVSPPKIV